MPKIKGWTKIGESKWVNRISGMEVGVVRWNCGDVLTTFDVYGKMLDAPPFDLYDLTSGESFTSKNQAIDALRQWMREHPRG